MFIGMYEERASMSTRIKAIIRVGKSSDVKFNNVQAYRALTYRDVEGMLSEYDDISFVVFEDVKESDISRIKNILLSFNILGVIYNKHGVSERITDELGIQAVTNLKELQLYIESQLGTRVSTFKPEDTYIEYTDINDGSDEPNSEKTIENANTTDTGFDDAIEALNSTFEKGLENVDEQVQNEDIMSKDDIEDADFDTLFNSIETEDKSLSPLEEIEIRKKYEAEIENLQEQLDYALKKVRELSELKTNLEDEIKQHKDFIDRIKASNEIIEVYLNSTDKKLLEQQINELQTYVNQLKIELEEANSLKETIDQLNETIQYKDNELVELQKELEKANSNEKIQYFEYRIKLEVSSRIFLAQALVTMCNELLNTQQALSKKMQEIGQLLNEYKKLELSVQELNVEKEELTKAKQEIELTLGNNVATLSDKVSQLTLELADATNVINEQKQSLEEKNKQLVEITEELKNTKELLEATQKIVNEQSLEVRRFEEMGVEEMRDNMLALEQSNSTLIEEIGRLRRHVDELTRQINNKDSDINRLSEEKKSLTIALKAAAKKIGAGESMKINCQYSGRAFILPVFGSGSYGITSTAISLAQALEGNILIMDFDIVNPKIDTWFKVNPLNKSLPDIDNELKKTAFGALVEKGSDYVINHRHDVVVNISETKNSRLDYFSGIYTKIDLFKLMAVDFSTLLTYFGNEYDYLVIDCGRLGGSEITNALIRMLDEISFKNIIVSLHDGADCRTMSLRIQADRISRNKSIWVLNLAKNDKIDSLMKYSLSTSNYVIFGRDMKIYGERVPYNKVGVLKDRLKKLVELILQ